MMAEFLHNLNRQRTGAEILFNETRVAVARSSDGEQVSSVSSSLSRYVQLGAGPTRSAEPLRH